MKRGDWIILGCVAAAALLSAGIWLLPRAAGERVVVMQNNEQVCAVPLAEDRTVTLTGNVIEIRGGVVRMRSADCKNQICVHHAAISGRGDSIVCLPNRVAVTIE